MRAWFPLLLTLAATGCLHADAQGDAGDGPGLAARAPVGTPASSPGVPAGGAFLPAVALRDVAGQPVRLEATASGKPALVSFWASWCDSCLAEVGALERLHEHAQASGGLVIGVAVGETGERAAEFARQHGLRYPQLVDETLELADALGQKRLPATIVLDRQGRVVFTGGALDEKALAAFRAALGR